jgi:hypothetical protein
VKPRSSGGVLARDLERTMTVNPQRKPRLHRNTLSATQMLEEWRVAGIIDATNAELDGGPEFYPTPKWIAKLGEFEAAVREHAPPI